MDISINLEDFSESVHMYYDSKQPGRDIMDRKKVLNDLRDEIESKRSKIENINVYIEEAEENLSTYQKMKNKFLIEIEQIEDTLDLMEI